MKRIGIGALALLVFLITVGLLRSQQNAHAQEDADRGWVEGVIVNEKGLPTGPTHLWSPG